MSDETPWEPPLAGTEAEALVGALDRLRWTFRYKVDGLDRAGLTATIPSSSLTLGGLVKHLAVVEDWYTTGRLTGEEIGEPWASMDTDADDWDFTSAAEDDPASLYELYDASVDRARTRLTGFLSHGGPAREVEANDGHTHANARRLLCDLLEEYGRHVGHADLLREAVDGRTGEDPPGGWRPIGAVTRG
jgi:hypothetical protein